MEESIYDTSTYFNNVYLDSWLDDDFSRRIIKAVDKAEVLSSRAIDSKALGVIPVTSLSQGTKTLLLIDHEPKKIFYASGCGDNCTKWILEIAKKHQEDITINLHHIMDFDVGRRSKTFDIRIVNTNEVVHNMGELVFSAWVLLRGEDET